MGALAGLISLAVQIAIWIVLIQVAISWLVIFGVINTQNKKAQNLIDMLKKITDPVYKPVQKYIPPIGGIDLTPLVIILGLSILEGLLISILT